VEYLKISGFQKSTIIAVSETLAKFDVTYRNVEFGESGYVFIFQNKPSVRGAHK
jgi:hypothetical protein